MVERQEKSEQKNTMAQDAEITEKDVAEATVEGLSNEEPESESE
ncbi:MAG TPA: hypothetical protein VM370_01690 [Candidatus Thermoplasmatota archaeon]|nr:hypothetical protein [Candidatus Thermoplasmatota archaeon]